jgi:hypothetical protein
VGIISPVTRRRILLGVVLAGGLGWYYSTSALEHARVVNTAKSRGDQSAYLFEAQILYRNWHGLNDPPVVQPRNRMPLYPAFLATIYQPAWTDPQFFEAAITASIYLSLGLLAVIAAAALRRMPPLPAFNFVGIVAFGYFVFKAVCGPGRAVSGGSRGSRHDAAPSRRQPVAAAHRARCVSDHLCGPLSSSHRLL